MTTNRGFTLLETLVTIAIFSLVLIACGALLNIIYSNDNTQPLALNEIDESHAAATEFVNEVRDASYGNDGSYPLGEASSTEIIFFSPFDSGASTTAYRIRYFIASSTLYKGITIPSGSPSKYNTAGEIVSAVISNVLLATTSAFLYYSGTYAGTSSPLTQPVNINNVTYVQLELNVKSEQQRNSTTTFGISTGAAIRNLKTNLGD